LLVIATIVLSRALSTGGVLVLLYTLGMLFGRQRLKFPACLFCFLLDSISPVLFAHASYARSPNGPHGRGGSSGVKLAEHNFRTGFRVHVLPGPGVTFRRKKSTRPYLLGLASPWPSVKGTFGTFAGPSSVFGGEGFGIPGHWRLDGPVPVPGIPPRPRWEASSSEPSFAALS